MDTPPYTSFSVSGVSMPPQIQQREIAHRIGGFFSAWVFMLSAYAQRRGSGLSGKTREGISQVKGADSVKLGAIYPGSTGTDCRLETLCP